MSILGVNLQLISEMTMKKGIKLSGKSVKTTPYRLYLTFINTFCMF